MTTQNARRKRNRKGSPYPYGGLRNYVGRHLQAETLVKHLNSNGRLVLLIGLPASGKSTISDAFEKEGWVRLNKDAIRKELYGDESTLGNPKEVSAVFYQRLEEALKAGRNILVDNTNVSTLHRKGPLAMAQDYGYFRITHVFMDTPLEECLRRNANRARKVPVEAMHELAEALSWPGSVPYRKEGHLIVLKPGDGIGDFIVDRVRMR